MILYDNVEKQEVFFHFNEKVLFFEPCETGFSVRIWRIEPELFEKIIDRLGKR